jgi:predicted metalloprotease
MAARRLVVLLVAGAVVLAACGTDVSVTAERAEKLSFDPTVVEPEPTDPSGSVPADPQTPPTSQPGPTVSIPADPAAINFGADKPPKAYDDFLLAVLTDLRVWWGEQYPAIYGEDFTPLEGGVYAAYPGRADDIPGCGAPTTTYQEVRDYVAFYCGVGDFLVYDDSDDGLLAQLARDYGAGTIGTVLAHEFGHAIQLRAGNLDRGLATILTEQQADCFAGAWTGRAARGEASTLTYSDGDVRAGLIAMTKVSDPVGIDQFDAGGHGSGFDRVGAFQVGYLEGPARCAEILDDPLPLVPNQFTSFDDQAREGNAPFGYGTDDLLNFLPTDLNLYWARELDQQIPGLDELTLMPVQSATDAACDDLRGNFERGAAWCASTNELVVNEPAALDLYRSLGDFSVGYLLGSAWGEAVQDALDSPLTGEDRALMDDCLTGGWVRTVIPVETAQGIELPQPRFADRTSSISAGDLDEAIQTLLLIADLGSGDNELGNAFEKIAALRTGVIEGTDACLAQL